MNPDRYRASPGTDGELAVQLARAREVANAKLEAQQLQFNRDHYAQTLKVVEAVNEAGRQLAQMYKVAANHADAIVALNQRLAALESAPKTATVNIAVTDHALAVTEIERDSAGKISKMETKRVSPPG